MKSYIFPVLFILTVLNQSFAHVNLLKPQGGEVFDPGNPISIEWQEIQNHETLNWDILFSKDGGITWDTVDANLPVDSRSYTWIVPEISTSKGQIKIVQDNVGMDYEDASRNFVISSITEIIRPEDSRKITIYPNPFTEYAVIEYDNPEHNPFSLTVYNTKGQIEREITDITSNTIRIERKNLSEGFFIFQLRTRAEVYFMGNLIVR